MQLARTNVHKSYYYYYVLNRRTYCKEGQDPLQNKVSSLGKCKNIKSSYYYENLYTM